MKTQDIEEIADKIVETAYNQVPRTKLRNLVNEIITTLTTKHQADIEKAVERAGTVFGIEVIVSPDPADKSYIKGYKAGMKDAKEQILKAFNVTPTKTDKQTEV